MILKHKVIHSIHVIGDSLLTITKAHCNQLKERDYAPYLMGFISRLSSWFNSIAFAHDLTDLNLVSDTQANLSVSLALREL